MRLWLIIVFGVVVLGGVVRGDVLILNDGTRLAGELQRTPDGWEIVLRDGSKRQVPKDQIKSVEMSGSAGALTDHAGLASLQRSAEFAETVQSVIDRYQKFIEQCQDPVVSVEAKKDLAVWQDRLSKKLVKLGHSWVTVDEKAAAIKEGAKKAEQARLLMKQSKYHEAELMLSDVLVNDPQNISALYLMGVMEIRAEKFQDARKSLTALQLIVKDHPPTLYNLAIVLIRQNQWGPALGLLDQSIAAAPNNQFLLDNITEALELVPEDQRKIPAYQKLLKRFTEQERNLQDSMARQKIHRWGSTWIDQTAYDKIQETESDVRKRMADMQTKYDDLQTKISQIESYIQIASNQMADIDARSWVRTTDNKLIRVAYPDVYYDLGRDIDRWKREKSDVQRDADAMKKKAMLLQAELPKPRFAGSLKTINEDGVPVLLPADPDMVAPTSQPVVNPSTRPATQPTTLPTTQPFV